MTDDRCPHGTLRNQQPPPGVAFAAPTGDCGCCGSFFMWVDHSMGGEDASGAWVEESDVYMPTDRCAGCGGHYEHTVTQIPRWRLFLEDIWYRLTHGGRAW